MQQKTKNLLKAVIFTVIMAAVLIGLNKILMPKTDFSAPIDRGVDEPDYILLGTSNVFYSLNPTVVWDEAGFTGYNVSSEEAPTMLSYYYLKDALKHRVPEVVYFEPTGFRFNYGNAAMNQLGVDKYPWGIDKFNLIMELQADDKVIGENYSRLNYFVPLYKFHSRWKDALKGDLGSYYERYETTFMGYVPTKVNFVYKRYHNWLPAQAEIDPAGITEVTDVNRYYFDKIVKLCEEYGTELKILKTPTKAWPIELREATAKLAEEYGIEYTDMNDPEILAQVGIDESKDFADEYSHLNIYGSEKVSRWIAKHWQETEDFTDKRGDGSDTAAFWDGEYARYEAYKNAE